MPNSYKSNINLFYLFKIVNSLELTLSIFVLFMLANKLTMTQVMILETIFILCVLLFEIPSGAFADLYGRKLALAISMILISASLVIFGLGSNFWIFLIAQIINSLGTAFSSGADSAFLYDSLKEIKKEKDYSKIYGRSNFLAQITWAISALLSGFLAIYLGYRNLFYITAFILFIGFLIVLLFKEPPINKKIVRKNYLSHTIGAIKFSYNNKIVRNLIIYFSMFGAFSHMAWFIIQPFYDYSDLPKYMVGVAIFLYFISTAIGYLTAEKFIKNIKEEKILITLLLIASLSFIGIFFVNAWFALLLISSMSFVSGLRDIIVNNGINKHTDSHHRATVLSVQSMSKSVMYAIFAPLLGYVTDIFSPSAAFLLMGISLFIFFIYYFVLSLINKRNI